jgi:hypothetical protein
MKIQQMAGSIQSLRFSEAQKENSFRNDNNLS